MSAHLSSQQRALTALAAIASAVFAGAVHAAAADIEAQWNPPVMERLKLPRYCWAQFDPKFARETKVKPATEICGVTMNHFCPGLVMLNRAQDSKYSPAVRHDLMKEAIGGINYTLRGMPPNCAIKSDVHAAKMKADMVMRMLPSSGR